jgi:protein associated with RNAse G/E
MRKIQVIKKKYDGSLCDKHEAYLCEETDELITLFSLPGTGYWLYPKATWLPAPDGLLEIYPKRKWYNIWHIGVQNSYTNLMYVNIAMPAVLQGETLEWVDLDLDYRVHLDHSVQLIDEDEFQLNGQRMKYPPGLIEQVYAACLEVENGIKQNTFPFDYEQQVRRYCKIGDDLKSE